MKTWVQGGDLEAADLNANFSEVSSAAGATLLPLPVYPTNSASAAKQHNSNTTGYVAAFTIPTSIVLNKISFYVSAVGVAGAVKIGIYSADGQTRLLNDTSAAITTASATFTHILSAPLTLNPGQYYFVIVPVSTTDVTIFDWNVLATVGTALNPLTSEPKMYGTLTVAAGTLPTTFNPSTGITDTINGQLPIMRFDS